VQFVRTLQNQTAKSATLAPDASAGEFAKKTKNFALFANFAVQFLAEGSTALNGECYRKS
jgi:hypothetical protein